MFTITAMFQGRAATVTYKNPYPYNHGTLTGDQEVIEKAQIENLKDHGYLGMVPDGGTDEYLSYEVSAYDLLRRHVFEEVISEKNDWEPRDPEST